MFIYKEKDTFNSRLETLKNKLKYVYIARLVLGIALIVALICYFTLDFNYIYLTISILLLLGFIFIVCYFRKDYDLEKYYKNVLLEYDKHEARRTGKVKSSLGFFDKGNEFKKRFSKLSLRDKYLIEDIDIFGNNSLYQNINQAKSVLGRETLAYNLIHGEETFDEFSRDNLAKKAYDLGHDERLVEVEAALDFNKVEEEMNYETYLSNLDSKYNFNKNNIFLFIGIIAIDIIILLLSILTKNYLYFIFIPIINIFYSFIKKNDLDIVDPSKIYSSLEKYNLVLTYLSLIDLKDIDSKLDNYDKYIKDIKKAKLLWQMVSYKRNILYKILINAILPLETLFEILFNKRMPNINNLDECFKKVAYVELLASYANVAADYNSTVGVLGETIEFTELANPLVKDCVPNDFKYTKGVILTGSNMSGKTTFMRTIGINLLLFNANCPVLATSFKTPKYLVYTSLRIKDELSSGVSTFYAEIEKIREIVDKNQYHKFCLIDEIFKGTNTLDRIYGAKKLVEKLESIDEDFIISTHDFELCNITTTINYHFEELYNEDYSKISFDYKLKEGPSHSTNAIFLLKSSHIID